MRWEPPNDGHRQVPVLAIARIDPALLRVGVGFTRRPGNGEITRLQVVVGVEDHEHGARGPRLAGVRAILAVPAELAWSVDTGRRAVRGGRVGHGVPELLRLDRTDSSGERHAHHHHHQEDCPDDVDFADSLPHVSPLSEVEMTKSSTQEDTSLRIGRPP